jgi:hypothetical protein
LHQPLCIRWLRHEALFCRCSVLLELWLIWQLRRQWNPIRPETIVLGLSAIPRTLHPDLCSEYLTNVVPDYGSRTTFEVPLRKQIKDAYACGLPLLLLIAVSLTSRGTALLLSGQVLLRLLLQNKGWAYHAVPLTGFVMLSMGSLLAERLPLASEGCSGKR